jgi:hypothetical protein
MGAWVLNTSENPEGTLLEKTEECDRYVSRVGKAIGHTTTTRKRQCSTTTNCYIINFDTLIDKETDNQVFWVLARHKCRKCEDVYCGPIWYFKE